MRLHLWCQSQQINLQHLCKRKSAKKIGPPTRLIEIFSAADDFTNLFQQWLTTRSLAPARQPTRQTELATMEILTIWSIMAPATRHYSGYKNFQYYFQRLVEPLMKTYFPRLISYQRFIDLIPRQIPLLHVVSKCLCLFNKRTGCYFADSKKLPVCDNRRIHSHRVFANIASRGKSSTGWRCWFKTTPNYQRVRTGNDLSDHTCKCL